MRIRGVIFDMDGVLTNSEPLIRAAAMAMFREMGLVVRPEDFTPFVGTGENRYIGGVAEQYGWPLEIASAKKRTYEIYLELVPSQLEPFPGACEVVRMCRAAGLKTAVASSADLIKIEANLRKIGLPPESWNAIASGDAIARTKPAPDIFLAAAIRLGLEAQECVVVEDTVHGIEAAHAAGMRCVAVGQTFPPDLLSGADIVRPAMTDVTLAHLTGADVSFSLSEIVEKRRSEQYDLHRKHLNPAMARVQEIIGFNRNYSRGNGAYLWDADGCRYLDLLSGYSVFNLGRSHPVLKQALQDLSLIHISEPTRPY